MAGAESSGASQRGAARSQSRVELLSSGHTVGQHPGHKLAQLDEEIQSINEDIEKLQKLKKALLRERESLRDQHTQASSSSSAIDLTANGARGSGEAIDYFHEDFPWSGELLPRAQSVWGIKDFRSIQKGVCNAALDGRDVVCVMPTGGGKSLCYQLPAIISVGMTLVISPLISLSMDQMWHLREAGVTCTMLSSADSREEANEILRRVREGKGGRGNDQDELKVLFVTPERVAKSKSLRSALQKCYERDHLSRIVIDEAHCCSQMGHDFRPDYKQLSILRNLYPMVPILCLSATLAPRVLEDVRRILNLPPVVNPMSAPPEGTVYFTAPLHRPNLHYAVVSRPSAAKDANQAITDWILKNHAGQSGIVYTLSRADTQRMADALHELSGGQIRAAVYHAELEDGQKSSIHHRWRQGNIHVVVATIAFGMGIDKGDVRFVVHASLGKSLDSYYQESGRAGRDGSDSDCVLFYRPADAARVSSLLASDANGQQKLHSMLEYAQSTDCRKSIFGKYFQDRYGDGTACGACDNCIQQPQASDVTAEAWKLLRVLEEAHQEGGRITLAGLGDLARGLGGGQYSVVEANTAKRKRGRRNSTSKQSGFINLGETIGEKVTLGKDDTERVLVALLLQGYIEDEFNATAYSINVYARPGRMAPRLTRLPLEDVAAKRGCPTVSTYIEGKPKKSTPKGKAPSKKQSKAGPSTQRVENGDDIHSSDDEPLEGIKRKIAKARATKGAGMVDAIHFDEEENVGEPNLTSYHEPIEIDSD